MVKKTKLFGFGLIVLMVFGMFFAIPAQAAKYPSYAYTFTDSEGVTHYKYYQYSSKHNMYIMTRWLHSKGKKYLYTDNGVLLSSSLFGKEQRYNVYDENGNFYFITSSGATNRIQLHTNTVEEMIHSGSKYFNYNNDDIGVSVVTSSGTKKLSSLKPVSPDDPDDPDPDDPDDPDPDDPTPPKAENRVEPKINSLGETIYRAYKNNKLKLTLIVSKDETKVLNKTAGVRLTDTLKGAKFAGIDTSYNVYLYELPGTLYKFTFGNWYSASKVTLSGTFKSYKVNKNGFATAFVTTKGTFTIKDLENKDKWRAKRTYAVTKNNYATLYIKGTTSSKTLKLSKGKLYLGKKQIATGVSKFGFVSAKTLCYIAGGTSYTAPISNPTKATVFCKSAKSFKRNSANGLTNKVVLKNGKTKKIS